MRSKTGFAVLLLALASAMGLWADATNGTLYYTTFSGGVNVHRVD